MPDPADAPVAKTGNARERPALPFPPFRSGKAVVRRARRFRPVPSTWSLPPDWLIYPRSASAETPPMRSAITASVTPWRHIQSFCKTIGSALASAGTPPADLPPLPLAEAPEILTVDPAGMLPASNMMRCRIGSPSAATSMGGYPAARLPGAAGRALIRLGM